MTSHALTPEELARFTRQGKLFERLATGRRKGERVQLQIEPAAPVNSREADAVAANTVKQRLDVKQALFFFRETKRRMDSADQFRAQRAAAMEAPAYEWKPTRPARR